MFNLSTLNGNNGFVINGIDIDDQAGVSVSSAGDVNGDGLDDLIIGAYFAGNPGAGESYVVFGKSTGFASSIELSALDGSNGFAINGIDSSDNAGGSVSSAGDVNGDGLDDLIIGADGADPNSIFDAGESYVVFGKSTGFASSFELSALDGSNGFVLNGTDSRDRSGRSVSSAGDVNGDGLDDFIIGADNADPIANRTGKRRRRTSDFKSDAGESYVVFGASTGFASSVELSALDGSNGFVINGINTFDRSGGSVSSAGDVNGDGLDDLIIGAYGANRNGNPAAGESYVVLGKSTDFESSVELSDLDGSNGFALNGTDPFDRSGRSVSSAGDVNGDGFNDLIIGASSAEISPNGNPQAGESYVVFGKSTGFASSVELSALDGSNGFVINGINIGDRSGNSVSGAGDVNGDGLDDLIIGAINAAPNGKRSGESYVVFGKSTGFASRFKLFTLNGSNGFVINGIDKNDFSGNSVSSAGDINGDGFDDLIIGADGADPNGNLSAGESYVILGGTNIGSINGSEGADRLRGSDGNDTLIGLGGRDTLISFSGNDILIGGKGADRLLGGDGRDSLTGGTGNDFLSGQAGNDRLIGVDPNAATPGSGEKDTLLGGQGADRFVLGDASNVFYLGNGNADFARVRDFNAAENDRIQLSGNRSDYSLRTVGSSTRIFADDGITTDLVGIVQGVSFADFSSGFTFV